jgi:hypothetical protein
MMQLLIEERAEHLKSVRSLLQERIKVIDSQLDLLGQDNLSPVTKMRMRPRRGGRRGSIGSRT